MPSEAFSVLFVLALFTTFPAKVSCDNVQKTTLAFIIDEELPIGARIGSLTEKLAVDFNLPINGGVNFVPLTDEQLISINRTTGLLTVRRRIDRENLCKETGSCCPGQNVPPPSTFTFHDNLLSHLSSVQDPGCAIIMLVMDQRQRNLPSHRSQEHPLIQVIVYVNDLNDNPPGWSLDKLELEIPEHTAIGRKFQLPEAIDPDHGPDHTVQSYRLIPSESNDYDSSVRVLASDAFELSSELFERSSGAPFKISLGLKVKADLDREKKSVYQFLLIAIDGGSPQLTGSLSVVVQITDINDHTPYFRQPNPSLEIAENTSVGTQIYTVVALDDDPSDANRLEYRMGSTASAEVQRLFSIDSRTGSVVVTGDLDYESAPILPSKEPKDSLFSSPLTSSMEYGYVIPIEVSDQAHIAETKLRIRVLNVNDNPPTISIQSPLQPSLSKGEFYLLEDAPVGTLVATITMTDADERGAQDGTFQNRASLPYCSTANTFFSVQPLHTGMRNFFKVVTSKPLDREAKSTHRIDILCHDTGQPVLSTKQHLTVRLEDVNDSPPVFDKSLYYARIMEGLPVHTPIVKIHAVDADTGSMAEVRYRLVIGDQQSNHDQLIMLDEKTGQIRSGAVFDREAMASINFTVEGVDCAGGNGSSCMGKVNTATAEVIVLIEDSNDCTPEFDQQSYEFSIEEGHVSKLPVGKVHAIDRDADPKNNRVRYHINDEGNTAFLDGVRASRFFSITPTGEIYTNPIPIDREQVSILTFSVVAIDSGEPPLSAFATVVIRVEDINDNGPQWVYPLPCPQATSINISAYSTVGMIVARLEAIDPDIGVNGQVEYEIIRGNGQNYFDLDRHSGTLYLKKSLELGAQSNSTSDHASPTSFALSLKATDGGDPPRSNVSILRILVQTMDVFPPDFTSNDGGRSHRKNQQFSANGYLKQQGNYVDRDLLVMIVMIIITLLVSVLLIMAIVLLRCRQIHSTRETGIDPQTGSGGAGGVGIMRVAQIKPHPWLPPPSHDSSAKSGFTVDSSKSGNAPFDGHAQYMTSSDQFVASDATLKSIEGVPVAGTYDRFSPAVIVSTSTFQRPNQNSDPSSVGTFVYTSKHVGDNTNPCYIRQVCATLPNNATARPLTDASGRCYMTLNPELYEIEHPYGQLKYHSGAYQSPGRGPKTAGISAMIKSTPNIGEVESSAAVECVRSVEPPMVEIQKRCRFKIDSSGSRPLLASNTPIFDKSESTEETVDGEMELESMQMKRLRTSCNSVGPEDSLLVNIH